MVSLSKIVVAVVKTVKSCPDRSDGVIVAMLLQNGISNRQIERARTFLVPIKIVMIVVVVCAGLTRVVVVIVNVVLVVE